MDPLDLVNLSPLMELTSGSPDIVIGLVDGPVFSAHPHLAEEKIRLIPGELSAACSRADSIACAHGTFVAGLLCARQETPFPGICPACTLLVRPIFSETVPANGQMPGAAPAELAEALIECIEAGAQVINLSASLVSASSRGIQALEQALDYAARRSVMLVAAAGNQGLLGSSVITRHPWVIPVIAYDRRGKPMHYSNLGSSVGKRGLGAPGDQIAGLGVDGKALTMDGTSAAAPFVTGALALLLSEFPGARVADVKYGLIQSAPSPRNLVTPPLLDAWAAHKYIASQYERIRL